MESFVLMESAECLDMCEGDCEWRADFDACVPVLTEASEVGDQYSQLTLELIVCLENNVQAFKGCRGGMLRHMAPCTSASSTGERRIGAQAHMPT